MATCDSMNAFGQTEVTSKEITGGLEFQVDHEHGWFLLLAFLALPVVFLGFSLAVSVPTLRAVFSLVSLGFLAWIGLAVWKKWNRVDTTVLSVTGQGFRASGAGLAFFDSHAVETVPLSEVTSVGYMMGGDNDPSGLYVGCGSWKSKCLLPGLNRAQATAIAVAITRRFPEIGAKRK